MEQRKLSIGMEAALFTVGLLIIMAGFGYAFHLEYRYNTLVVEHYELKENCIIMEDRDEVYINGTESSTMDSSNTLGQNLRLLSN